MTQVLDFTLLERRLSRQAKAPRSTASPRSRSPSGPMGAKLFNESKQAILEYIEDLIGLDREPTATGRAA